MQASATASTVTPLTPAVSPARAPLALGPRWAWPARLAVLAFAALAIGVAAPWSSVPDTSFLDNTSPGFPRGEVVREGLRQLGIAPRTLGWALFGISLVQTLVVAAVVGLLLWRRAREVIALLICVFLIASSWANYPPDLAEMAVTQPVRAFLGSVVTFGFIGSFILLFFVFPDGRFTPRWVALLAGAVLISLARDFFPYPRVISPGDSDIISMLVLLVAAVAAQVYRYRRVSGPVERQQTKWFSVGLGSAFVLFVVANVIIETTGIDQPGAAPVRAVLLGQAAIVLMWLMGVVIPVTLAVSIFRFRLFDIDVVINRALVYGGMTAAVVGLYVVIVGGLSARFHTGQSLLVSLIATGIVAVVFQTLRDWLQRSVNHLLYGQRDEPYAVLAGLGHRLGGTLAPDAVAPAIVASITEALRLPWAAVALGEPGRETVVAATGAPGRIEALPLVYQGETLGELRVSPRAGESLGRDDRRLLEDLARQVGPALHAVRLTSDLQRSRERLVLAREEERRRLRRDLHDGLGPRLAGLTLRLEAARDRLDHDPQAGDLLDDLSERTRVAVDDVRRLVYGLRPPALDDLGLAGALRQTVQSYESARLLIEVDVPETLSSLPAAVEVAAYRIAEEALTNVVRHAAAAHCVVRLALGDGRLIVEVEDDGRGIPEDGRAGVGLGSMRERAAELGGTCIIEPRPGGGTRVQAVLPCRASGEGGDG